MKRIATLIASLALLLPGAALAAGTSSTCQTYNNCPSSTQSSTTASQTIATTPQAPATTTTATPVATTATTAATTLPFTGLDVVLLAAGGLTLVGAGLLVRRFSRGIDD
ncbi:MAG: hypothetical protein ACLP50_12470 [Solirubrobacteraceae bacterium]